MRGLRNKINDCRLINFLSSYDVIILLETFFTEVDFDFARKYFSNFRINFVPAIKKGIVGRPIGGILVGLNLNSSFINNLNFVSIDLCNVVRIKFEENYLIHILPVYLNCNFWERDFNALSNYFTSHSENNYVIIGDCNARIADKQCIDSNIISSLSSVKELRNSKDTVLNLRGKKYLEFCETFGQVVLNGRTIADEKGEYTFINNTGSSVIDLASVSLNSLDYIKDFTVKEFIGSDHMPIQLEIYARLENKTRDAKCLSLLPKLMWSASDEQIYKSRVESRLNSQIPVGNVETLLDNILECVRGAVHQGNKNRGKRGGFVAKKPWFDKECERVRSRVFKLLNLYRSTNTIYVRHLYIEANKEYNKIREIKRKQYNQELIERLKDVKNTKQFWEAAKSYKTKQMYVGNNIKVQDWVRHFKLLLDPQMCVEPVLFAEPFIEDSFLNKKFDKYELRQVLKSAKNNKAPGFDRIPYEFYKYAPDKLIDAILNMFNLIFDRAEVPSSFKKSIVYPLHKKGNINEVGNYRGICFMDTIAKLFTGLILNRLEKWVGDKNILDECQAGFRKGYSTVDNIFNLMSMINLRLSKKRSKLYCFFVDFSAAFDRIDRKSMFYKLYCLGISTKIVRVLQNLYNGTAAGIWCDGGVSECFETSKGLRQGCLLSPLLFSLFMNDLHEALGGGYRFGDTTVRVLLYADDIVLVAPAPVILQYMINNLEKYCDTWNLKINLDKSKIMIFRNGGKLATEERWRYKGDEIEIVNSYKYLGVILTPTLAMQSHLDHKLSVSKNAVNHVWANFMGQENVSVRAKFECFRAVARSIMCYGAQVWGYREYEAVEKLLRFFIKRILCLPRNTPNYMLYLETNQVKLFSFTLKLHFKYILRVLKMTPNRLPNILAREVIKNKLFWFRDWQLLADMHYVQLSDDTGQWKGQLFTLLESITNNFRQECIQAALASSSHVIYSRLNLALSDKTYVSDKFDIKLIRWVFKCRGELLHLNYKPWLRDQNFVCSLCNTNEYEDTYHFIAKCPILSELRKKWFKYGELTREMFFKYLNGHDWLRLAKYAKQAWQYRWTLVQEFNY